MIASAWVYAVCRLNVQPRTYRGIARVLKLEEDRISHSYRVLIGNSTGRFRRSVRRSVSRRSHPHSIYIGRRNGVLVNCWLKPTKLWSRTHRTRWGAAAGELYPVGG